ncbi:hypothetical protein PUNSTDRAFT_53067 [Punctularia strigosozonata HHB-11173 SS5]|uniref:uncharacterized protein n=1 Tax=Punctularia strigosozonata (strain HHB-11173) TaxID=741275 RepID=UPI000441851A|nr:uncharacterized protein PUNSTDRAFT_53067 [Punctularia strigosozonata HHB-11173 SS5]EIN07665.1 hypothetical protein PUNSTDRAFT_53067 [Punctularia strigosozonata HHB-11173 SS5]
MADQRSLSPHNSSDLSSSGSPPPMGHMMAPPGISTPPVGGIGDDEIIPTAIVIKNIPFNVKKETLLDIITSLSIPTPYAFNYHLDQSGAFRGLAFANFRQPADADAVVVALNGFDVQGRKLRVEYKKVLQAGEKERIEREKALRRMRSMQLEKEHISVQSPYEDYGSPPVPPAFTPSRSFSGVPFQGQQQYSPPRVPPMPNLQQQYSGLMGTPPLPAGTPGGSAKTSSSNELDLNDPATLEIYSRILLFKDDPMRDELAFSRTLSAKQRRVVHLVAQKLGVYHYSVGEGEERYAVVTRINPELNRPAPALSRAPSAYHLQQAAQQAPALRAKKSMPDISSFRTQAPRLNTRMSNGNMREGYATIASPARRSNTGTLNTLFNNGAFGGGGGAVPPVPTLPASVAAVGAQTPTAESPSSTVVRQPKGPGAAGFMNRRPSEQRVHGEGLDARTHEPLEI